MTVFTKLLNSSLSSRKKRIVSSALFQQEWYAAKHEIELEDGQDFLDHYLTKGEESGYFPNPYFDPAWYRDHAKLTSKFNRSALEHYIEQGSGKGLSPSRLFDHKIYVSEYPEAAQSDLPCLSYHLKIGQHQGKCVFHRRLNRKAQKDGRSSQALIADMKLIAASGLFDEDWYLANNLDLRTFQGKALLQFVEKGASQGRKPNPVFDPAWYRHQYMSATSKENPLVNYIRVGSRKGWDPAENFSCDAYKANAEKTGWRKGEDPLKHFLLHAYKTHNYWPTPSLPQKQKVKKHQLPVDDRLREISTWPPVALSPVSKSFFKNRMNIHWIIPEFSAGAGGHMTIFRMASFLERFGHTQTIWIHRSNPDRTDENGYDDIQKHFQFFSGEVKILDDRFNEAEGDALIATDCWTVWPSLSASKFTRRFYFVQDFEPSFHPMGASYLAAEQTYKEDLDCICASPWLSKLMEERYGKWARPFWLAADSTLYHPAKKKKKNRTPRIAFYARHFTARRAVELGFLALETLAKRGVKFEVDFFGADLGALKAPFKFKDHGVAAPEKLATLFQAADLGVVFSATNYSLVPKEMMACGLPLVELKGESTECIFPPETVTLAEPHPERIADALEKLIGDKALQEAQAEAALNWVSQFSWEQSARIVEHALIERLGEYSEPQLAPEEKTEKIKASVVIPTYNAGRNFKKILDAVVNQETPWPFEVLVIDSGSTDSTLRTVKKYPSVRLHSIESKDFNHGATRNLGVELTSGEFIAFLTHDALPADNRWLYKLVTSLERVPEAAGAFGAHLPYADASPFTKRDLNNHFEMFNAYPLSVNKNTDKARYKKGEPGWRQFLHFYSDNNSCMRRSVWDKIPYRPIQFGEDQIWADDIIKAGYSKVYSPRARVYHSHDFTPEESYERNKTESAFFKHFFGYELIKTQTALEKNILGANKHDTEWAKANRISAATLKKRLEDNEARLKGYLDGATLENTSALFD